jgi:hypothetical protein
MATVNQVGPANCWRFVYNTTTKVVKQVFLSSGITKTLDGVWAGTHVADAVGIPPVQPAETISSSAGYAEAIAEISLMGLTYVPPQTLKG